jgi:broad specificity phosphatase PhoE
LATLYLIRHGTTDWVDQQILHGVTDIPLNENGLKQAARTAEALKGIQAKYLFSSPLTRAMQTAEIIGRSINLIPQPVQGLIEIDFGWREGKRVHDDTIDGYPPILERLDHYWLCFIRFLSGESQGEFKKRVKEEWRTLQASISDENALIVCHSGVLSAILEQCFGNNYRGEMSYYISYPCSITEIKTDGNGHYELVRLNDYSHLSEWYPHAD